jgi:hypothetical protein
VKLANVVLFIVEMLVVLLLIEDSTSVISPRVKVPSISASLRIVTVPEVWPRDKSPVEKSPVIRSLSAPLISS